MRNERGSVVLGVVSMTQYREICWLIERLSWDANSSEHCLRALYIVKMAGV